jgi:DNA-binding NarL/FixJ family response regulator
MPESPDPAAAADASWADIFAELSERNPLFAGLAPAERLVAQQVHRGLSNREIASALGLSEATVKRHVSACLRKFGVRTRTRLIALLR